MIMPVIFEHESVKPTTSSSEKNRIGFDNGVRRETEAATTIARIYRLHNYPQAQIESEPNAVSIADLVREFEETGLGENLKQARKRLRSTTLGADDRSLKALRLAAGCSQSDVALAIGSTQAHIARLESGCIDPTLAMCTRLARLFSVDHNRIAEAFESARRSE